MTQELKIPFFYFNNWNMSVDKFCSENTFFVLHSYYAKNYKISKWEIICNKHVLVQKLELTNCARHRYLTLSHIQINKYWPSSHSDRII